MKLWGSKGRFRGICQNKQIIWYKIVTNFMFIEIASDEKNPATYLNVTKNNIFH